MDVAVLVGVVDWLVVWLLVWLVLGVRVWLGVGGMTLKIAVGVQIILAHDSSRSPCTFLLPAWSVLPLVERSTHLLSGAGLTFQYTHLGTLAHCRAH